MSYRVRSVYATVPAFRRRVGIDDVEPGDTTKDDLLWDALVDISDLIDQKYGGTFQAHIATREYTARESGKVWVDDLLAVTSVATDDGSRTWGTAWLVTDWALYPRNGASGSLPTPYYQLRTLPQGAQSFPIDTADGVRITGTWGRYEVLRSVTALSAAVTTTTATTITVPTGKLERGHTIVIDSEQLLVTATEPATSGSTDEVTVERAMNGTTAATHLINAPIRVYTYPLIEQACLLQAHRSYMRSDTPLGYKANPAGGAIWVRELDPDVEARINLFRVPATGVAR